MPSSKDGESGILEDSEDSTFVPTHEHLSTPKSAGNHARQLRRIVDNWVFRGAVGDECAEELSDGI
jgi:hypothetical protein